MKNKITLIGDDSFRNWLKPDETPMIIKRSWPACWISWNIRLQTLTWFKEDKPVQPHFQFWNSNQFDLNLDNKNAL